MEQHFMREPGIKAAGGVYTIDTSDDLDAQLYVRELLGEDPGRHVSMYAIVNADGKSVDVHVDCVWD